MPYTYNIITLVIQQIVTILYDCTFEILNEIKCSQLVHLPNKVYAINGY